jgi:hypothetical protein
MGVPHRGAALEPHSELMGLCAGLAACGKCKKGYYQKLQPVVDVLRINGGACVLKDFGKILAHVAL